MLTIQLTPEQFAVIMDGLNLMPHGRARPVFDHLAQAAKEHDEKHTGVTNVGT